MKNLYVFFDFTPDGNGGKFYMPKSESVDIYAANSKVLAAMKNDHPRYEIYMANTFKVYDTYIDLPLYSNAIGHNITYLAIETDSEILFYYVQSVKPLPQGYRLYISIDYWATYISISKITNVNFNKTNLQVGNPGEYLYITEGNNNYDGSQRSYTPAFNVTERITRNNLRIFAAVRHKSFQDISTSIEELHVYRFDPQDIATTNGHSEPTAQDIYDTIETVFNIYAVTDRKGGEGSAQVLHLYILENVGNYKTAAVAFKSKYKGTTATLTGVECNSAINEYNIIVENGVDGYTPQGTPYDPGQYVRLYSIGIPIYFGTKYNYLTLPNFVSTYVVKIRYEFNQDKIVITVSSGNDSRDITEAFEVAGVANTGTLTTSQSIAKWLGIAAQAAGGIFQMIKGGAGYVTGAVTIASAATGIVNQQGGTIIGGGDGLITFREIIDNGSGETFYFSRGSDNTAGQWSVMPRILFNGANCNIQYKLPKENLLNYLHNLPALYLPDNNAANRDIPAYIECTATIDNIPYDAAQVIADTLKSGVHIRFIENEESN